MQLFLCHTCGMFTKVSDEAEMRRLIDACKYDCRVVDVGDWDQQQPAGRDHPDRSETVRP